MVSKRKQLSFLCGALLLLSGGADAMMRRGAGLLFERSYGTKPSYYERTKKANAQKREKVSEARLRKLREEEAKCKAVQNKKTSTPH